MKKIKLVISDVDGVLTNGELYYSEKGDELKKFSIYDGGGVALLKIANIPLIIISGENNNLLKKRFNKLKISDYRLGVKNKENLLDEIKNKYSVKLEEIAFIGDFINDYNIMKKIGFPACPKNADDEIKKISKMILQRNGGEGVLWEFTKKLLKKKGIFKEILEKYYADN